MLMLILEKIILTVPKEKSFKSTSKHIHTHTHTHTNTDLGRKLLTKKKNSVTVYKVKYIWKVKIFATQFRQVYNILGTKT